MIIIYNEYKLQKFSLFFVHFRKKLLLFIKQN